ncbi:MAG: VOC family protein [Caulobacteraceae bacterium]
MPQISPFLWFDGAAEEAARFYVAIFPNSRITGVVLNGETSPGPTGLVMLVNFELDGQPVTALNGGPQFRFNEAVSLVVHCEDQAQIDYYWDRLSLDGSTNVCGWLKDRYGLSWQVVPAEFMAMVQDPDPARRDRVMDAMMLMTKFDLAKLREAFAGP